MSRSYPYTYPWHAIVSVVLVEVFCYTLIVYIMHVCRDCVLYAPWLDGRSHSPPGHGVLSLSLSPQGANLCCCKVMTAGKEVKKSSFCFNFSRQFLLLCCCQLGARCWLFRTWLSGSVVPLTSQDRHVRILYCFLCFTSLVKVAHHHHSSSVAD